MERRSSESLNPLTSKESIEVGDPLSPGFKRDFRSLRASAGEGVVHRGELYSGDYVQGALESLVRLVHVTDFQLADVKSPSRFEYLNRYAGDPRFDGLVPGYRPQEFLIYSMVYELVQTLNRLPNSELSGREVDVVLTTGDLIDNAQTNEFSWVSTLLGGGTVDLPSGSDAMEFVADQSFESYEYWQPEAGKDMYKDDYGFPQVEGILKNAMSSIVSEGLKMPWLGCNGNHEVLTQGVGRVTSSLQEVTVGSSKSVDIGPIGDGSLYEYFIQDPASFYVNGPQRAVVPDEKRAHVDLGDVITAYLNAPGQPEGHGFTSWNLEEQVAYFVYDLSEKIRVITLDTAVCSGDAEGAIDEQQLFWLEEQLKMSCSRTFVDGKLVNNASGVDRYVVITSHHPLAKMTNSFKDPAKAEVSEGKIRDLLHRYPNVILWISGHTHVNKVVPSPSPYDQRLGFFEVTTASIMDWPCQFRIVEIFEGDRHLEIHLEMGNVDVPVCSTEVNSSVDLASWHRLIAYNASLLVPKRFSGDRKDRNLVLHLNKRH